VDQTRQAFFLESGYLTIKLPQAQLNGLSGFSPGDSERLASQSLGYNEVEGFGIARQFINRLDLFLIKKYFSIVDYHVPSPF
jgi:hypothetical protein